VTDGRPLCGSRALPPQAPAMTAADNRGGRAAPPAAAVADAPRRLTYRCAWAGCGKTLTRRTNRRAHRRVHTGVQPVLCAVVGCGMWDFASSEGG